MLITKSKSTKLGVRKRTLSRSVRIGPLTLKFITLIMIAAAGLFYLSQSTQSATKSYQEYKLRSSLQDVNKKQEQLKQEAVRLKSLDYIKHQLEGSDLISTDVSK